MIKREREREQKQKQKQKKEDKEEECLLLLKYFTMREEESASRLYTIIIRKSAFVVTFIFIIRNNLHHNSLNCN